MQLNYAMLCRERMILEWKRIIIEFSSHFSDAAVQEYLAECCNVMKMPSAKEQEPQCPPYQRLKASLVSKV